MLRITQVNPDHSQGVLRLEGKLTGPSINELLQASDSYLEGGSNLSLDLASLPYADAEGVQALRDLRNRGVKLTNVSLLLEELVGKSPELVSRD